MTLPSKVVVKDGERLESLKALTKWYDNAPREFDEGFGDRFHENVSDMQHSIVDEFLKLTGDDEERYYLAFVELTNDGRFVVHYGDQDGELVDAEGKEAYIPVEFVAE